MAQSSRSVLSLGTLAIVAALAGGQTPLTAQLPWPDAAYLKAHYAKREVTIPMRDGVGLHTVIYSPKDRPGPHPILLTRTPYSAGPYGPDGYPRYLGPGPGFAASGYHFVSQDVRGRYRSEGQFVHMTPNRTDKRTPRDVDESTDTWDTIDWLVKNMPANNGRVGLWGISYGGFFAAEGLIDAHPALKAVSPQAPQADWFMGDDTHHNGAFFLTSTFNFMAWCGRRGSGTSMSCGKGFDFGTDDGYRFFLELGPLANAERRYFKGESPGWTDMMEHGTYDEFWKARNILPHLQNVRPAVLTVGGWYDANNFYGAIKVFEAIDRQSPGTDNAIVIGPWSHGQWARDPGRSLAKLDFGANTSERYHERILLPFFEGHLKGNGWPGHPKAWVFETGTNQWRTFDVWPPKESSPRSIYLAGGRSLSLTPPSSADRGVEEWTSDPANPVPFVGAKSTDMDPDYMAQDQRFAVDRPDVVAYRGEALTEPLTIAGAVTPELYVSSTGTDGDWVVKLIDVHPDGFQELVRGDVVRAKFRASFEKPEPLTPGQVTRIEFTMPDVFHTFRPGHRLMVQVQGSWFPLVDRNPQTFVDIYRATEADFRAATQRVHRGPEARSRIVVNALGGRPIP
ncbi:MAG: CocE/NonD family hydrolase [Gemmatimonadetes bacterium]|nr:CocE/NonD family hydrolase [Gemmatimonadota bacterium]